MVEADATLSPPLQYLQLLIFFKAVVLWKSTCSYYFPLHLPTNAWCYCFFFLFVSFFSPFPLRILTKGELLPRENSRHGRTLATGELSPRENSRHGRTLATGELSPRENSRHGRTLTTGELLPRHCGVMGVLIESRYVPSCPNFKL